jgi:hypothetical protein
MEQDKIICPFCNEPYASKRERALRITIPKRVQENLEPKKRI